MPSNHKIKNMSTPNIYNKHNEYYVWNGVCTNKPAYDLYIEYIKASDGYCHDELQEEADHTWTIFTRVDLDDWYDYPYHVRFIKLRESSRIEKCEFKTAAELMYWKNKKMEKDYAVADVMAEESDSDESFEDHSGSDYDDLYCNE